MADSGRTPGGRVHTRLAGHRGTVDRRCSRTARSPPVPSRGRRLGDVASSPGSLRQGRHPGWATSRPTSSRPRPSSMPPSTPRLRPVRSAAPSALPRTPVTGHRRARRASTVVSVPSSPAMAILLAPFVAIGSLYHAAVVGMLLTSAAGLVLVHRLATRFTGIGDGRPGRSSASCSSRRPCSWPTTRSIRISRRRPDVRRARGRTARTAWHDPTGPRAVLVLSARLPARGSRSRTSHRPPSWWRPSSRWPGRPGCDVAVPGRRPPPRSPPVGTAPPLQRAVLRDPVLGLPRARRPTSPPADPSTSSGSPSGGTRACSSRCPFAILGVGRDMDGASVGYRRPHSPPSSPSG